jgi:hypothetical protein
MFIITSRIRALVALGAVAAAIGSTATASAATVSASMVGHKPVTIAPIVVTHPMIAHVSPVKGAGSAGIAGYDDATCESLAQDNNTAVNSGDQAQAAGDTDDAISNYNLANNIYHQLSDNCMVID